MDTVAGRLVYLITGDNSHLKASSSESQKTMNGLASTAKSTSLVIKRYLAGGALVLAGKQMINLSSSTKELSNKFNVVFNGAIKDTNGWLEKYTDAVGRGDLATREYLTSLQDIRTGFGDSIPEASKFSQAVVGVTNDLSSFSNIDFEETSAAIQSGLSGQFEALRRLGVGLNVAIINQGEYSKSIDKTWLEMDNLQKQEAVLSGIMSQSSNALGQNVSNWREYNYQLGDAAKTAGSYANQSKAMTQEFNDMASGFGDVLMPEASTMVEVGRDLIAWLDDLSPAVKEATIAVAGLSAAFMAGGWIGAIAIALGTLALKVKNASDRSNELKGITEDLVKINGEYKTVVQELSGDIRHLSEEEKGLLEARKTLLSLEMEKKLAEYAKEYKKFNDQLEREKSESDELEAKKRALLLIQKDSNLAEQRFMELHKKRFETFALSGAEAEEYNTLLTYLGKSERKLAKEIEDVNKTFVDQSISLSELEATGSESILAFAKAYNDGFLDIEIYKSINHDLYEEIMNVASGLKKASESVDDLSGSTNEGSDATDRAIKTWKEYLQEILGLEETNTQTGVAAAKSFLDGFERELQADQEIYKALNGNLEEWTPLPILKVKAREIKSAVADLLSIDPKDIDSAFVSSDKSVQILLNSLRETEAQIKNLEEAQKDLNDARKAEEKSIETANTYNEKLEDLNRTSKERLEAEKQAAIERAKAEGLSADAIKKISDYYDELIKKANEANNAQKGMTWQDWTMKGLSAISDVANAFDKLNKQITENRIAALDAQMEAELRAMGLLEEENKNKYTQERKDANQSLQDLQKDAKKETDLEKKNELMKAAAAKAVELDKLITKEANEEKKIAIEEKYERKKAQLEYEAAMQSWNLKKISAIAGGAMAVLSALQTQPWFVGLAMSAIAGLMSGIEIATVKASKPTPPSFAVGAWEIPSDMNANIHKGEMILPQPFADSVRSGEASLGGSSGVHIEIYTSEPVETDEQTGLSGEIEKVRIFVGKTWKELYNSGKFDSDLNTRHGIRKVGKS